MKNIFVIIVTGFIIATLIPISSNGQSFSWNSVGLSGGWIGSIAWGDFDNDDDLDILVTGFITSTQTSFSKIYRNNGNSTFTDINAGLIGSYLGSANWVDYDNDGDLDISLTGYAVSTRIFKIYRNNGNSTFTDINAN